MNRRQADILELLETRRELTVSELAQRFGVTTATVRRDFQFLEDEGYLIRGHGSAMLSPAAASEVAFVRKGQQREAEKRAIGRAVAAEIHPGMIVSLDTGTTILEVARAIANIPDIKVLTVSLPIASLLHAQENLEVILMGGTVRKNDPDLSGVLAEENLRRFRADLAVLGADAVGRDGIFTTDMNTARAAQAMMAGADRRFLAVDSSKFSARAMFRYAGWDEFTQVVSDAGVCAEARQWLAGIDRPVSYVPVPLRQSFMKRTEV